MLVYGLYLDNEREQGSPVTDMMLCQVYIYIYIYITTVVLGLKSQVVTTPKA